VQVRGGLVVGRQLADAGVEDERAGGDAPRQVPWLDREDSHILPSS
jgi:hypothetical protein